MSRKEFLENLKNRLSALNEEERENAVRYYEEFFDECENEQEALKQLDSVEVIAEQILKENGIDTANAETVKEEKKPKNIGLIILIVILTFPLWIGFVAGAFGILIAAIAVVFSFFVSSIVAGVSCLVTGIITLFSSVSLGLILIGLGLIFCSLFVLLVLPLSGLVIKGIRKLGELVSKGLNKLFRKGVA